MTALASAKAIFCCNAAASRLAFSIINFDCSAALVALANRSCAVPVVEVVGLVVFDESLSDNDGGIIRIELVNSLRLSKRLTTSLFSTTTADGGGLDGGCGFVTFGLIVVGVVVVVVVAAVNISNKFRRGLGN